MLRDIRQTRKLESLGWRSFRVWEHQVFTELDEVVARVKAVLGGADSNRRNSWRVIMTLPEDPRGEFERRTLVTLRDEVRPRVERHKRHTRKWKRPLRRDRFIRRRIREGCAKWKVVTLKASDLARGENLVPWLLSAEGDESA